ncbi:dephospho-CoA kinase [Massilia sp. R2A-15]|uniref:dephospho-CoA kinase n=1 Tax=Massilia sp. R2A-15 TaxID=3064278 RepID=UPI002734BBAA|nr:dephospho-CoA kinase [Massilia sp. R2A-15]WLI89877.1 dephospho-CoA kinase [Massilia sp. R2A-15]
MDNARGPLLQIGLTGGIGCGKTTVADMFAALGASVVDTDLIAHSMTVPGGPAMAAIAAEFGPAYLAADGALDRAAMRALVFSDPSAKQRLEAILHPLIRAAAEREAAEAKGAYVIFVVPLLIESGNWRGRVARVLAIDCPESMQIARVMARNGLPEAQVRGIMAAQVTRAQRLAAADDVIVNDDGIAALAPQVEALHRQYITMSSRMTGLPLENL